MPLAFVVKLPSHVEAEFPDFCTRCCARLPAETMEIRSEGFSLERSAFVAQGFVSQGDIIPDLIIPFCSRCLPKMKRLCLRTMIIYPIFSVAVLVGAGLVLVTEFPNTNTSVMGTIAGFVILLPYVLLHYLKPAPFFLRMKGSLNVFRFQNAEYAEAFAVLNEGEVE